MPDRKRENRTPRPTDDPTQPDALTLDKETLQDLEPKDADDAVRGGRPYVTLPVPTGSCLNCG